MLCCSQAIVNRTMGIIPKHRYSINNKITVLNILAIYFSPFGSSAERWLFCLTRATETVKCLLKIIIELQLLFKHINQLLPTNIDISFYLIIRYLITDVNEWLMVLLNVSSMYIIGRVMLLCKREKQKDNAVISHQTSESLQ